MGSYSIYAKNIQAAGRSITTTSERACALEYRFSAISGEVKITHVEFRRHVGKLLHRARLKVNYPEILVLNLAAPRSSSESDTICAREPSDPIA